MSLQCEQAKRIPGPQNIGLDTILLAYDEEWSLKDNWGNAGQNDHLNKTPINLCVHIIYLFRTLGALKRNKSKNKSTMRNTHTLIAQNYSKQPNCITVSSSSLSLNINISFNIPPCRGCNSHIVLGPMYYKCQCLQNFAAFFSLDWQTTKTNFIGCGCLPHCVSVSILALLSHALQKSSATNIKHRYSFSCTASQPVVSCSLVF